MMVYQIQNEYRRILNNNRAHLTIRVNFKFENKAMVHKERWGEKNCDYF